MANIVMADTDNKQGKCFRCDTPITPGALGYCHKCAEEVYAEIDAKYPYEVLDGDGCHIESFETESQAKKFVDRMRYCTIEKKAITNS